MVFFARMDFSQGNLFGYIEDLQELTIIERPVRRSLKTPEEIERLTVDEELNDIERAVYLLSSGQDIQGTSVVANLPVLMRQNPAETLRRVLPKIREVLHVAGVEMQLTAAVSFLTVLQDESVSIHTYSHSFLHIILQNLEHRDAGVSNAWLETLLAVIEALPKETIRHEILNPLVSKTQISQSLQSRLVSCKIMGKLAYKFEAHIVKREILPLVKSLCQDVEYEVRTCMCRQLEHIAQGIGTELTKTVVLPELVELARDEGSSVRLAAFETIVNLLDMFDADDRSQTVLPLVKSFCEKSFKADESILVSLSFHLGKLCNGLYGIFTPEQHLRFLEFYKKLSTLGLQQENGHNDNQLQLQTLEQEKKYISVRKNCAYNFPAMIVFVDPKNFHLELYSIFFCLCHDPEVPVRYTMAISFYEVAKLLNSGVYTIHKELVTLLQDESLEVLDALVGHLPEILELMTTNGGENSGSESKLLSIPDLIPALTTAEQRAATSLKWRTHEKLLQKYACLPHIISSDQIYYRFLHRMLTIILTNNVLPVQKAAARTLCVYLRYNRKQEQRHEVIQKLIEQLGQGKSYWNRLRFLDTCEFIMELFSKSFFCKYFFLPVLELTHDPVANVRMKLCYLLPKVKSTLKIPSDKHLLQQLELCIRKLLCQEKDKDVLTIVKRTVLELDRMDISLDAEQLEKEKQQSEGRSTNVNDKIFEKKRRDNKTSSVLAKSMTLSVSGSSSGTSAGKEDKKSKLVRSQSFSTQALHPKYSNIDKCPNKSTATGYTSSISGMGKSCMLSFTDDTFRTRSTGNSGNATFPSSSSLTTSRNSFNSADQKNNGNKESQSRKMSIKNRKSNP
ncbi:serine/threonine-protein phosphatase 4 regulatory subunit 4 isoform X2 [Anas platyrhynchos]|uniref:Serine/threonine-protein phosphatase 4 regulatory subunit 4 n=1 Tax=Anas zonorhyncha TaxID=75864 RepID=A0A8B9UQI3_9AVES|nr:serine/threonine-protein phosphatase 4 regulatory subunit 4 isoform X3 [Anas platyrhynchos]|eukprot:XP_021129360.2 serine/threonine-protein phosphatase 4 regulatory subunit 4 isoform X3 [Anas platyrhynchos]